MRTDICLRFECNNEPTWRATVTRKYPDQDQKTIITYGLCHIHLNWTTKEMADCEYNLTSVLLHRP